MTRRAVLSDRPVYGARRISPTQAAAMGSTSWSAFFAGGGSNERVFGRKGGGKKKGGGASGTTATVTPDTIASRAVARGFDAISEGPYGGLIDGLKSVFLDDTPLQNANESFNFRGVSLTEVLGTADQEAIPGFSEVEAEEVVNVEAKVGQPVVRTINDSELDAVKVKVRIPSLMLIADNGSVLTYTVEYLIRRQDNGGSFVTVHHEKMKEKFGSPCEFEYRVPLTPGGAPWNIELVRLTADDSDEKHQSATFFASYTKIIDAKLTYPFTGGVGWTISAEQFGSEVPSRAFEVAGIEIDVPANYDPITREYATVGPGTSGGVWDGTFKSAATDNPAWWLRWLQIEPRYGCGDHIPESAVDKWSLYTIARYCDELVPDGKGGVEPRYRFNYPINTRLEAFNVLQSIVSVFRGMMYWGAGAIIATADMPADPVRNVAPANMINNSLNYEGSADRARHSVALVTWNDPDDGYRPAVCVVENKALLSQIGWVPKDVLAFGCTSEGQAYRTGAWILDTEATATELASWQASFDQADVAPGDVVNLLDPDYAGVPYGGRLIAAAVDNVTLDRAVEISSADNATLTVVMADGKPCDPIDIAEVGTVTTIAISPPFAEAPAQNAVWIISSGVAAPRQFRVLTIGENEKNKFPISALFHDPTKYDRIEQGINLEPQPYSALPTGQPLPPKDVSYREYLYKAGPSLLTAVHVAWTPPADPRVILFEYQASPPGESGYTRTGRSRGTSVDLDNISPGEMTVLVRSLDGIGRASDWVPFTATVFGLAAPPADVAGFNINIVGDQAYFRWDPSTDLDVAGGAGYARIKYAPTIVEGEAQWETSADFIPYIDGTSIQAPALSGTFLIKWVDSSGVQSTNAAVYVNGVTGILDFDVTETVTEQPDFAGIKVDVIVNRAGTPYLMLDYARDIFADADVFAPADIFYGSEGLVSSGTYYFAQFVDLSEVYTSRVTASMKAGAINTLADFFAPADFFASDDFFQSNVADWGLTLYIATTSDDPYSSGVVWSDWQEFITGDYLARGLKWKVVLSTPDPSVTPTATELSVTVNMPDRVIADNDVAIIAAGTRIDFSPPFQKLKGLAFGETLSAGMERIVTLKDETGFTVQYKSGGVGVAHSTDYVAKGYGRKAV